MLTKEDIQWSLDQLYERVDRLEKRAFCPRGKTLEVYPSYYQMLKGKKDYHSSKAFETTEELRHMEDKDD